MERRYDEMRGQYLIITIETLTQGSTPDWLKDEIIRGANGLDLVRSGLNDVMRLSFQELSNTKQENDKIDDFHIAAYVITVNKISRSYIDIGVY